MIHMTPGPLYTEKQNLRNLKMGSVRSAFPMPQCSFFPWAEWGQPHDIRSGRENAVRPPLPMNPPDTAEIPFLQDGVHEDRFLYRFSSFPAAVFSLLTALLLGTFALGRNPSAPTPAEDIP